MAGKAGSFVWQVQEIYNKSGIKQIGTSKHAAKEAVRAKLAASGQSTSMHEVAKHTGIHSYSTADAYRGVWVLVGKHTKTEFGEKRLENLTGEHVQAFLESKIAQDVTRSTFALYASACEKLEVALNGYAENKGSGKSYDFSEGLKAARGQAGQLEIPNSGGNRAYDDPKALIAAIANPEHRIAAAIEYESGARISEATWLSEKNLRGISVDPELGRSVGVLYIEKAKGGISGEKYVTPATYHQLAKAIRENGGRIQVNQDRERYSLKVAAKKTEQDYTYHGSHGLRWNFVQELFRDLVKSGISVERALIIVSERMFHHRPDITLHYLNLR